MTRLVSLIALILLIFETRAIANVGPRDAVVGIVAQIQLADYEDDRPGLKKLFDDLAKYVDDKEFGARVCYWRGFAMWRRVLNGFNDSVPATEQARDLQQAVSEFDKAIAKDPNFVDAKIGENSCLGSLIFLNRNDPAKVQELAKQAIPLLQEAAKAEPNNPRLLWVEGSIHWYEGAQDKAFETYQRGMDAIAKEKKPSNPLEPSWGEPELLMNLAWSNLNRTTPDLDAAEKYANSALKLVPNWHYVKDILLPQIRKAKAQKN